MPIFVLEKAAAPKSRVEFPRKSIGVIRGQKNKDLKLTLTTIKVDLNSSLFQPQM